MIPLLWKEWCERSLWFVFLAVSILVAGWHGHAQAFCGEDMPVLVNPWFYQPVALAVLAGAGGYVSELHKGRADFIFSRPISWHSVLLVKLLIGAAVILFVPLLSALAFRVVGPLPYRELVTPATALAGAWPLIFVMAIGYLVGLACSLIVPGIAGGMLTVIVLLLLFVSSSICLSQAFEYLTHENSHVLNIWLVAYIQPISLCLVTILAAFPLARFGLTLDTSERLKRFLPRLLVPLLLIWGAGLLLPESYLETISLKSFVQWSQIDQSGRYAFVAYGRHIPIYGVPDYQRQFAKLPAESSMIVSLPDHKPLLNWERGQSPYNIITWTSHDSALLASTAQGATRYREYLVDIHTGKERTLHKAEQNVYPWALSPDGDRLLQRFTQVIIKVAGQTCDASGFVAVDLQTGNTMRKEWLNTRPSARAKAPTGQEPECLRYLWWQDNDTIGYQLYNGHRQFIHLPDR